MGDAGVRTCHDFSTHFLIFKVGELNSIVLNVIISL